MNSLQVSQAERKVMRFECEFDQKKMKYPLVSGRWVLVLLDYIENIEQKLKQCQENRNGN